MAQQSLNKQSLKALRKAINLFRSAPRWIKGDYQRTAILKGREIDCYCLLGAFRAASGTGVYDTSSSPVSENLALLATKDPSVRAFCKKKEVNPDSESFESTVICYNDDDKRTYPQIVALLQRMKAKLEKRVNAEATV